MKSSASTPWLESVSLPAFAPLSGEARTEVAIIGGGITGMLTAYLLAKQGTRVLLLERDGIGSGATAYTTGFLSSVVDTDFRDLIQTFGLETARLIVESHAGAIQQYQQIIHEEDIDCAFTRCDGFAYALSPDDADALKEEADAAQQLGLDATFDDRKQLPFRHYPGVLTLTGQGKINILQFIGGLLRSASPSMGIHERTEVKEVREEDEEFVLDTPNGTVRAAWVISAAHQPFGQPLGLFFRKGQYRTYIMELRVPAGALPEGIYEDALLPYHYFRVDPQGSYDRVILGGEDHRQDLFVPEEMNFAALERYAEERLGPMGYSIERRWTGPILEPSDGLAIIGAHGHDRRLYASGFSGVGLTYAAISARLFADVVAGRENPYRSLYDPTRFPSIRALFTKGKDYSMELVGGAVKNVLRS